MSDNADVSVHTIQTANGQVSVSAGTRLSPASLSNGDLFQQYGVALAGRVSPLDSQKRPNIIGLIAGIPNDIVPPSIDESSIYVEYLSPTSVKIHWKTDKPSTSTVEYDHDKLTMKRYGLFTQADHNLVTEHSVVITDLSPNTLYAFRPYSTDIYGNSITIRGTDLGDAFGLQEALPEFHTGQINQIDWLIATSTTSSTANIEWFTTTPINCHLELFILDGSYNVVNIPINDLGFVHKIEITDLTPKSQYAMRVVSNDNQLISDWRFFNTI
jgi:hypothetical protein